MKSIYVYAVGKPQIFFNVKDLHKNRHRTLKDEEEETYRSRRIHLYTKLYSTNYFSLLKVVKQHRNLLLNDKLANFLHLFRNSSVGESIGYRMKRSKQCYV